MDKYLKALLLLLITIFSLTLPSCDNHDDNEPNGPNDPESTTGQGNVTYLKKANSPIASFNFFAVLNDEIYFANYNEFMKYSSTSDKWTDLTHTLKYNTHYIKQLFVYKDKLFVYMTSNYTNYTPILYTYNVSTNSFEDAKTALGCNPILLEGYAALENKLFTLSYNLVFIYNPSTQSWEKSNEIFDYTKLISPNKFIQGNNAYFCTRSNGEKGIYQFNSDTYITSKKIDVGGDYNLVCAYDSNRMLCLSNGYNKYNEFNWLNVCLYTPTTNEYKLYKFGEDKNIPITTDKIIKVGQRFFVGPTNASFYEVKFNL